MQGVKTAAGFISDEEIVHPHLDVEVPPELLDPIFTFADEELRSGRFHDVGTTNTLNMFIQLRKFVVIVRLCLFSCFSLPLAHTS